MIGHRPRGGTGRRTGLKIRCSERDVSVRLRPGPPFASLMAAPGLFVLFVRPRAFGAAGGRGRGHYKL